MTLSAKVVPIGEGGTAPLQQLPFAVSLSTVLVVMYVAFKNNSALMSFCKRKEQIRANIRELPIHGLYNQPTVNAKSLIDIL